MALFIEYLVRDPFFYFGWILLVMFSVSLHEYAHARMAYQLGDDSAWLLGHFSVNPLVQMGMPSLIALAIFGIGWGAVPVSYSKLRTRGQRALVALAGPTTNLLLVFIFAGARTSLLRWSLAGAHSPIARVAEIGGAVNSVLFVLNILPIPVLDGWEIVGWISPQLGMMPLQRRQQIGLIVLLALFLTPIGNLIWIGADVLHQAVIGIWIRAWFLL